MNAYMTLNKFSIDWRDLDMDKARILSVNQITPASFSICPKASLQIRLAHCQLVFLRAVEVQRKRDYKTISPKLRFNSLIKFTSTVTYLRYLEWKIFLSKKISYSKAFELVALWF